MVIGSNLRSVKICGRIINNYRKYVTVVFDLICLYLAINGGPEHVFIIISKKSFLYSIPIPIENVH